MSTHTHRAMHNTARTLRALIVRGTCAAALVLSACATDQPTATKTQTPPTNLGQIWFRVQYDVSNPGNSSTNNCNMLPVNYVDDNPMMPFLANAQMYAYVGPVEPGSYSGQFALTNTSTTINFSYYVERPAAGYKRYYTFMLWKYSDTLGRCINYSSSPPAYYDEKIAP